MESGLVSHNQPPSSRAALAELKLEEELTLAQLRIKKLELEVETSGRISEAKLNLTEQIFLGPVTLNPQHQLKANVKHVIKDEGVREELERLFNFEVTEAACK
ncbi:unnamed protein product [Echinostoma caproni]|uniref:Lzipper-MIP1 domain-containing protein n=1 Tax=Echinostoma caproni TaxID=27848 RepID=A0A183A727_9TREM|nr:unnamed protein product [Echinostoma caproni]